MSAIRWTTIRVPVELRDQIKQLAQRSGKAEWRVISEAISFYSEFKRSYRVRENMPLADKISWYIAKISMSVGALKENPTQENLDKLKRTASQIKERIGIDTSYLVRCAEEFFKRQDRDSVIELNMALKLLILEMMDRLNA